MAAPTAMGCHWNRPEPTARGANGPTHSRRASGTRGCPGEAAVEIQSELLEQPETDSLSDPPEGVKVKDEIVNARERPCIHLAVVEQVPQIRPGVTATGVARALVVDGPVVTGEARITQVDGPVR